MDLPTQEQMENVDEAEDANRVVDVDRVEQPAQVDIVALEVPLDASKPTEGDVGNQFFCFV